MSMCLCICPRLHPLLARTLKLAVTETCFGTSRSVFVTFRIHFLRTTFAEMLLRNCRNVEARNCLSIQLFQLFLGATTIPWTPCLYMHTATHCSTLRHSATQCNTLQHSLAPWSAWKKQCRTLHYTAHTLPQCNTLQHAAAHCNTTLATPRSAPHCNSPHLNAPHCTTPHHTATHCNTLHHTATHSCIGPGLRPEGEQKSPGIVSLCLLPTPRPPPPPLSSLPPSPPPQPPPGLDDIQGRKEGRDAV